MGMYCDIYTDANNSIRLLDWSSESDTMMVLQVLAGSALGVIIVLSIIPFNVIMLFVGLGAFLGNTALFRAVSTTLPPVLLKSIQEHVGNIKEGILSVGKGGSGDSGSVTKIALYENQRWWAGLGWIPHLLRSERSPWSDETGNIQRPTKEEYPLPNDPSGTWTWVDPEWRLDMGWSEVDDGGWKYTDHSWANPKDKANVGSLTRRRLWVREMKFTPNPVDLSNEIVGAAAPVRSATALRGYKVE
ncbi:peroxisome- protein [Blyttiomyces sp. JEL0837]|nr:peroxisome- protein [Blyttiomyces sp. JEL0837]